MTPEALLRQFDVIVDAPNGVQKLREMILVLAFTGAFSDVDVTSAGDELRVGWRWRSVADLASFTDNGFACNKQNEVSGGYVHLRTHNVGTDGKLNFDLTVRIAHVKVHPDRATLRAGDVIFNNTNSQELVGKTCLVDRNYDYGFSNHLTRIRLKAEILPAYLVYYFNLMLRNGSFASLCNRWIGQAGINTKMLREISVPVPPLPEQHRIVAKVDELLALCDALEARLTRAHEKSAHLAASVVHHLTAT